MNKSYEKLIKEYGYGYKGLMNGQTDHYIQTPALHGGFIIFGDTKFKDDLSISNWHRIDGPAVLSSDGKSDSWYFYNSIVAFRFHGNNNVGWSGKLAFWAKENNIDLENLTEDDITLIKLTWIGTKNNEKTI